MKVWIYTDGTPEALPLLIEDSAVNLAKKLGITPSAVRRAAYNFRKGLWKTTRFEVVEIEKDEGEDESDDLYRRRNNRGSRGKGS